MKCPKCGTSMKKIKERGSIIILVILLCCGLIPGVIYYAAGFKKRLVCKNSECGN